MSTPKKRTKPSSGKCTNDMDATSKDSEIISNLERSFELLQSHSCTLLNKNEAMQKLCEVIQLLNYSTKDKNIKICPPNSAQFRSVEVQTRETMLKVHIHELPNECLTLVFNKIDLRKMILLMRVCTRWHGVVGAICAGKQSLKLISDYHKCSPSFYGSTKFNLKHDRFLKPSQIGDRLKFKSSSRHKSVFTRQLCDSLVHRFPNVQHLYFARDLVNNESSVHLVYLFQKWSKLVSFNLEGFADRDADLNKNILKAIRQLSSLRHLYLITLKAEFPLPAKTLFQLDDLYVGVHSSIYASFLAALSKLKPSCRVRLNISTEVDSCNIFPKLVSYINQYKPPFVHQVTHFTSVTRQVEDLHFVFQHFVNLQYLEIHSPFPLMELLHKLVHLTKLTELNVWTETKIDRSKVVPLASVKRLTLRFVTYSDHNRCSGCGWCNDIRTIFPNLEKLNFPIPSQRPATRRVPDSCDSYSSDSSD